MKALKKWLKRIVWLAVLAAGGYYGWNWYEARNDEQQSQGIGQVPTEAAAVRDITVSVSANGVLRPVRIIQVKSKASGEILEMPVELGDEVRAGQLIAQIDTRILAQELAQAQADLDSAATRMEVSERQYQRATDLQGQDLVSKQDLDTAQQNYATAKAQLLRSQAELELRQERLAEATVLAPSSGRIIKKNVEIGTIITSSTGNVSGGVALVEMADLSRLEVRTLVDEIDIGRVEPGLVVETTVEAHPERKFGGKVVKIEPQAEVSQQITTFPVLSYVDNSGGLLLPGMNANVDIIIHSRPNVLAVPNEAVRSLGEAEQVATLLGIPFDSGSLRDGGSELTDAGARPGRSRPGLTAEAQAEPAQGGQAGTAGEATGGAAGETAGSADARADEPIDFSKMRGMSAEERRKFLENLTPAQQKQLEQMRAQFAQRGAGAQGGAGGQGGGFTRGGGDGGQAAEGGGGGGNTTSMAAFGIGAAPQEAVVFVVGEDGRMTPRLVMAGVKDWEYTEIASGLQSGDKVVLLPSMSLLNSQQAMRERFQSFAGGGVPGSGGGGGRPR